ncbi:MAG: AAA family ATPase [Butyrivibrio sp.]|nr:AAA family ATPase [Butyrivibrio sp.]
MNRDYIDESMIMPMATNTFKPDPTHKLIAVNRCRNVTIPYLKTLDEKIHEARKEGCNRFLIVADRRVTARKVASYINGMLEEDEDDESESYSDDFFSGDESYAYKDCGDEDEEGSYKYSGNEDEDYSAGDDESHMILDLSVIEEINLQTPSDEEKRHGKRYNVARYADQKAGGILVTGLEDGIDLEEKTDAIKSCNACMFLWVPKDLINDSSIYELELMADFMRIEVEEPDNEYYAKLLSKLAAKAGVSLARDVSATDIVIRLKKRLSARLSEESIDRILLRAMESAKKRDKDNSVLKLSNFFMEYTPGDTAIERLERMVGLTNVKNVIKENMAIAMERCRNKMLLPEDVHSNMIFCGNPGTGKTTTAKLFSDALCECGSSNGILINATRSDLVGRFVGSTAPKVAEAFKRARGGVLFLDEAGWLLNSDSGGYVAEAVKELVRFMECESSTTVIFGCYGSEAKQLLELDAGLRSRISRIVEFPDYTGEEVMKIAGGMYKKNGYKIGKEALQLIAEHIDSIRDKKDFGNARDVRRVVEASISSHSVRIHLEPGGNAGKCDPDIITPGDVKRGIASASRSPKDGTKKRTIGFDVSSSQMYSMM